MTVRENIHELVDRVPDELPGDVFDYLTDAGEPDESLSAGTKAAIEEGLEGLRNSKPVWLHDRRFSEPAAHRDPSSIRVSHYSAFRRENPPWDCPDHPPAGVARDHLSAESFCDLPILQLACHPR